MTEEKDRPSFATVLANRTYRHLFTAQVIALVGTGLMTVALGLLAFRIAGNQAGAVLNTAFAIKMIAYVEVVPIVGGFANRLPRRAFLAETEAGLKARGFRSRIHVPAMRNHPLSQRQEEANRKKSRRAASELASSMYSAHRRLQPEAGSCGQSASSERERRLDCRTSCTISAVS